MPIYEDESGAFDPKADPEFMRICSTALGIELYEVSYYYYPNSTPIVSIHFNPATVSPRGLYSRPMCPL